MLVFLLFIKLILVCIMHEELLFCLRMPFICLLFSSLLVFAHLTLHDLLTPITKVPFAAFRVVWGVYSQFLLVLVLDRITLRYVLECILLLSFLGFLWIVINFSRISLLTILLHYLDLSRSIKL